MSALDEAYAQCEAITKAEAKNFAYGIRLLPDPKRRAMSALYAFARRVDDIGDGPSGTAEKLEDLARIRMALDALDEGEVPEGDPVLVGLLDATRRYAMSTDALRELVTGCEMDCSTTRYDTWEALAEYCRCVAGSIGRLSLEIFGCSDPERGRDVADTLGLALQLTNVLRDIVEDRDVMGRVYLPSTDLDRFGVAPDASGPPRALAEVIAFECARAEALYGEGLELLALLDHRSRACVAAMAGIYRRLLARIAADPLAVLDHRVSVPAWQKAAVAARSLVGVGS
jgi:phytoene synthase